MKSNLIRLAKHVGQKAFALEDGQGPLKKDESEMEMKNNRNK